MTLPLLDPDTMPDDERIAYDRLLEYHANNPTVLERFKRMDIQKVIAEGRNIAKKGEKR